MPAPSQPPDREKTAHPANPSDAPIRRDLVERIRREIAEGTYETPEKWEAALERFLEEEGGRQ
ncbi:MAG: flagellar biosynthesis anti-sigma factor FlgM [Planctomycetes bacterium]|nr:flagellar biosynthesis anti-sigma factor FlgM [Planctomycetota bacterium]